MRDTIDELLKGIGDLPLNEGNMRVAKAIQILNDNIFEIKGRLDALEKQSKSSDGGSGTGHYGAGPWG